MRKIISPPEVVTLALASIAAGMYAIFGRGNVGFVILIGVSMVLENLLIMVSAALFDDEEFSWKEFIQFWLKRLALLALPLVGTAVDLAWYWMSEPDTFLGSGLRRFTTKTVLIGVLAFQLKSVVKQVLYIWGDIPPARWLMYQLDKLQLGGEPPANRRRYDPEQGSGSMSERFPNDDANN